MTPFFKSESWLQRISGHSEAACWVTKCLMVSTIKGRHFDATGKLRDWWAVGVEKRYNERAQRVFNRQTRPIGWQARAETEEAKRSNTAGIARFADAGLGRDRCRDEGIAG